MKKWTLLACISLTSAAILGQAPVRAHKGAPEGVMSRFAEHFRGIEKGLRAREATAVHSAASSFLAGLDPLPALAPERNQHLASHFQAYLDELRALLGEVQSFAARGNLDAAAQSSLALRNTCVSCHVKFRANNEEIGLYPATGNTVTGRVELRDVDGEERDDRSWVLVYLEREGGELPLEYLRPNPILSQKGRQFTPRVLPVVKGTTVTFPNDDSILHNVFSLSKAARFDLGVYANGETRPVKMERTGLVRVYCNLHPEMAASIVVLGTPHFVLTDESGNFVIPAVPDGRYRVRAWNDAGAGAMQPIELVAGELVEVSLQARETKRPAAHKNKFGKRYPAKY